MIRLSLYFGAGLVFHLIAVGDQFAGLLSAAWILAWPIMLLIAAFKIIVILIICAVFAVLTIWAWEWVRK